jgi:hypothetical protein
MQKAAAATVRNRMKSVISNSNGGTWIGRVDPVVAAAAAAAAGHVDQAVCCRNKRWRWPPLAKEVKEKSSTFQVK